MKCFSINSSWLNEFNNWSAEFYTLLKKEEYIKITKMNNNDILENVKNFNLTRREVLRMESLIGNYLKKISRFRLDIFKPIREPFIKTKYYFSDKPKELTEKQKELNDKYLNEFIDISKDSINIKQSYVYFLGAIDLLKDCIIRTELNYLSKINIDKVLLKKLK